MFAYFSLHKRKDYFFLGVPEINNVQNRKCISDFQWARMAPVPRSGTKDDNEEESGKKDAALRQFLQM